MKSSLREPHDLQRELIRLKRNVQLLRACHPLPRFDLLAVQPSDALAQFFNGVISDRR